MDQDPTRHDTAYAPPVVPATHAAPGSRPASVPSAGGLSLPEIDHYELDGIPLFHLPGAGATTISLQFRVGSADEPVPQRGMTHLAEHLLLSPLTDSFESVNGTTESHRLSFHARGTAGEAARFLREVSERIARADVTRIGEEAKVLRTEAAGRGRMGLTGNLVYGRMGYEGIGKTYLPELFLRTLDEERLRSWIAANLVAGNAAIWIAGPLPDGLFIELPAGSRRPLPPASEIPGFETPTLFVIRDAPGLGASFMVRRSVATSATFRALDRRLRHALRVDRGLGYEVGTESLPLDADRALALVWATCLPEAVRDVERALLEALDAMGQAGVTVEELEGQRDRMVRETADPANFPGRLDARTRDFLLGQVPMTAAELEETYWRLSPDDTAKAMRDALDTMLLVLPAEAPRPQRPLKPYPGPSLAGMGDSREFEYTAIKKSRPWGSSKAPRLVVGDRGIAITTADRRVRFQAVLWEDCVGVVHEAPWARSVIGRDGYLMVIDGREWRDGGGAIKLIDRHSPRSLVVQ